MRESVAEYLMWEVLKCLCTVIVTWNAAKAMGWC